MRATLRTVTAALLLTATIPLVLAQTEPETADSGSQDFVETGSLTEGAPDIATEASTSRITIDLRDVELRDVIMLFSRMEGVNLIAATSNLNLQVSAKLDDVEWRPALQSILSVHNMAMKETPPGSGVYQIIDRPPDAPDPLVVQTLFLRYATVNEVRGVIQNMLPSDAQLSVFPSRNAMVLRSTEANIAEIESVIKELDIQQRQVCVETQFFELNDEASKQLGIRWDSLEEFGLRLDAGPFDWTDEITRERTRSDSLTRSDTRGSSDVLTRYYDVDGRPYESEENLSFVENPGDSSYTRVSERTPTREFTDSVDLSQTASSEVSDLFAQTISQNKAAILDVDGFNVVISALRTADGVSVVSNPKIIVSSGQTNAFFSVGTREPIIKKTIKRGTVDSPGDEIVANLDTQISTDFIRNGYLNTGIELRVVPVVKTEELIEAEIVPSLRRKVGDKTVEGNTWPIISVKEISTQFTLRSGQTVAIGGLTDTSSNKQVTSIPVLGAIPIIGKYLFSHEKDVKELSETIIFVTLSLADAATINTDAGIPVRSELIHEKKRELDARAKMLHEKRMQIEEEETSDSQVKVEDAGLAGTETLEIDS